MSTEDAIAAGPSPRTLLLVDDEESIVSSLTRLLRREGYRILSATGGEEGLSLLAANRVDVIVSDQRMPGMTGVEFLRRVKTSYPETVRIVLSGYTELQSITDAINEGAIYKFLTKPWDDDQLRANIREAFRHKELDDENRRLSGELTLVNEQLRGLLAEKQSQSQRDRLVLGIMQEMLQLVPLPIIGFDEDGLIVCANEEASSLFGPDLAMIGVYARETLPSPLAELVAAGHGEAVWQDAGSSWLVRCRPVGNALTPRGGLLIFSRQS